MDQKALSAILLLLSCALAEGCHCKYRRRKRHLSGYEYDDEPLRTKVFITKCMTKLVSDTPWNWEPVTEFMVMYSGWFEKTAALCCSPPGGEQPVDCWKNSTRHVFRKDSELLPALNACIDVFPTYTWLVDGVSEILMNEDWVRGLADVWLAHNSPAESSHYKEENASSAKIGCPITDSGEYNACMQNELHETDENIVKLDYRAISRFMEDEGDCKGPYCDCSAIYKPGTAIFEYLRVRHITCKDCWATKIAGFISTDPRTSRLRKAAIYCSSLLSSNGNGQPTP